jgi:ribosomal protein S18 acetylase RimI-like enzyme
LVQICRLSTQKELRQIQHLQSANLKSNLSLSEQQIQGFVTASYTFDFLKKMNELHPAIIAKEGDQVVGYALVTTSEIKGYHPLLDDLIGHCDEVVFKGVSLATIPYAIVGQLCVAKAYRGQGLVQKIYTHFKESLQQTHHCCITDVDQNNPRSLKAHQKTGFEVVGCLGYGGSQWDLVLWDWNRSKVSGNP